MCIYIYILSEAHIIWVGSLRKDSNGKVLKGAVSYQLTWCSAGVSNTPQGFLLVSFQPLARSGFHVAGGWKHIAATGGKAEIYLALVMGLESQPFPKAEPVEAADAASPMEEAVSAEASPTPVFLTRSGIFAARTFLDFAKSNAARTHFTYFTW